MALFGDKLIRGSVHPYVAYEAIAVGVCDIPDDDDLITSTHRGHGHCIAKGLDVTADDDGGDHRARDGLLRRQGRRHAHHCRVKHGMLGADAIVGGSPGRSPSAPRTGVGCRAPNSVTVAFFGDGARNQGIFHEAANLASILKSPTIFVCENNQWAISMPFERAVAIPDVAPRAQGYGMPGVVVDGNDVQAVRAVAETAVARARAGDGPTLVEAKTFRACGRTRRPRRRTRKPEALIREWEERDPIQSLGTLLRNEHGVDAAVLEGLDEAATAEIEAAVATRAMASAAPDAAAAFEDVYAPADWQRAGRLS